jgi:hypothetical protein
LGLGPDNALIAANVEPLRSAEVLATITREVEARSVANASRTPIGAVQTYCVSVMPNGDPPF